MIRGNPLLTFLVLWAFNAQGSSAFPIPSKTRTSTAASSTEVYDLPLKVNDGDSDRRNFLTWASFTVSGLIAELGSVEPAHAKDELFKKNPLTNPILEQIRIWEQAEADELKYGGELIGGDVKGTTEAYSKLLVPILQIAYDLEKVNQLVQDRSGYPEAIRIMNQARYQKIQFKKIFNAYGDNIYYSDPDRANAYLGGGATPKSEQSLAYLLRNEILTNVESLQAELDYLMKDPEEQVDDLLTYARSANDAMERYLEVVPPAELRQAKSLMNAS